MNIKPIPSIDWDKILERLSMEFLYDNDPEGIVHEICHQYDCVKEKAFESVGNQHEVTSAINIKYSKAYTKDMAEICVSAMTYLVLEPLGLANLEIIIDNMYTNLIGANPRDRKITPDEANKKFLAHISDHNTKHQARIIRDFLLTFKRQLC